MVTYEQILSTIAAVLQRDPIRLRVPPALLKVVARGLTLASRATGKVFPLNDDKVNEILPDTWVCSNDKANVRHATFVDSIFSYDTFFVSNQRRAKAMSPEPTQSIRATRPMCRSAKHLFRVTVRGLRQIVVLL